MRLMQRFPWCYMAAKPFELECVSGSIYLAEFAAQIYPFRKHELILRGNRAHLDRSTEP